MDALHLYMNGIQARTGQYSAGPIRMAELADLIRSEPRDQRLSVFLRKWWQLVRKPKLGTVFGVDPLDLDQAQWGIIFHIDEPTSTYEAVSSLIQHRHGRIFDYRPGETKDRWLMRHGVGPGSVNPALVPYYLLIIGNPTLIPYDFQYQLDVQYAVGRICFEKTDQYWQYCNTVVAYEHAAASPTQRIFAAFATKHRNDPSSAFSSENLVQPVITHLPNASGWPCIDFTGDNGTKFNLTRLLKPSDLNPALVFLACHGLSLAADDPEQALHQGALICQDWPGRGPLDEAHYFGASDLEDLAHVYGKIIFCFACFGAGTPHIDSFTMLRDNSARAIAQQPFVSALAQKLLSYPEGGALAFVGHIDRAWEFSFSWGSTGSQPQTYLSTLQRILAGMPIGHAMDDFNLRFAELSTMLVDAQERPAAELSAQELVRLWVARNDARSFVVIGDPAVRIRPDALAPPANPQS